MDSTDRSKSRRLAGIGGLLLVLPGFFILAALLEYVLGMGFLFDPLDRFLSEPELLRLFNVVSPVLFIGGALIALALNLFAVVMFNIQGRPDSLVGSLTIRSRPWNLAIVGMSFLVLGTLTIYVVGENWKCWAGIKATC